MSTHRKIVNNLEKIVKKGVINCKELEFGDYTRTYGEVDYLILNRGILFLFEVKTNKTHKNYEKALSQLDNAAKHYKLLVGDYFPVNRIQKYFVHGDRKLNPIFEYVGKEEL